MKLSSVQNYWLHFSFYTGKPVWQSRKFRLILQNLAHSALKGPKTAKKFSEFGEGGEYKMKRSFIKKIQYVFSGVHPKNPVRLVIAGLT